MYHFNGTSWVRLAVPKASTAPTANFHGVNITATTAYCSTSSPVLSSCKIFEEEKPLQQSHTISKNDRRAPLKQLFPRTPTPFKKAYAAAVRKGGEVEPLDLQKSPELFEDLQEIIIKDVILPPTKRSRRTVSDQHSGMIDQPTTSYTSSVSVYSRDRASSDNILDMTSTPSKILNDSSFLMSPPFKTQIPESEDVKPPKVVRSIAHEFTDSSLPAVPPRPFSADWFRIACGRTSAQVEMTSMAKDFLRHRSSADKPFL